jgi:hypothetical protein
MYPSFGAIPSVNWYELPAVTFELLLCLWFLFRGLRSLETALGQSIKLKGLR